MMAWVMEGRQAEIEGVSQFIKSNRENNFCNAIVFTHADTLEFEIEILKRIADPDIKSVLFYGLEGIVGKNTSKETDEYMLSSGIKFSFATPQSKTMNLFIRKNIVSMVLACNYQMSDRVRDEYFDQLIFQRKEIHPPKKPKLLLYYNLSEWSIKTLSLLYKEPEEWKVILNKISIYSDIINARTWRREFFSILDQISFFRINSPIR